MLASKLRQVLVFDRVCASGLNLIMLAGFRLIASLRLVFVALTGFLFEVICLYFRDIGIMAQSDFRCSWVFAGF